MAPQQVAMAKKYDDTFVEYVGVGDTPTVISIKKGSHPRPGPNPNPNADLPARH